MPGPRSARSRRTGTAHRVVCHRGAPTCWPAAASPRWRRGCSISCFSAPAAAWRGVRGLAVAHSLRARLTRQGMVHVCFSRPRALRSLSPLAALTLRRRAWWHSACAAAPPTCTPSPAAPRPPWPPPRLTGSPRGGASKQLLGARALAAGSPLSWVARRGHPLPRPSPLSRAPPRAAARPGARRARRGEARARGGRPVRRGRSCARSTRGRRPTRSSPSCNWSANNATFPLSLQLAKYGKN